MKPHCPRGWSWYILTSDVRLIRWVISYNAAFISIEDSAAFVWDTGSVLWSCERHARECISAGAVTYDGDCYYWLRLSVSRLSAFKCIPGSSRRSSRQLITRKRQLWITNNETRSTSWLSAERTRADYTHVEVLLLTQNHRENAPTDGARWSNSYSNLQVTTDLVTKLHNDTRIGSRPWRWDIISPSTCQSQMLLLLGIPTINLHKIIVIHCVYIL